MVVAIKKGVIAKNREDRIATNDPEINNSYIRARLFIKNFSSQIFELFQAFHKCKDAKSSDLPYSIAILFPLVSIGKDEMSNLISMLGESIGQITAEDLLLINLSGKGFLKLREALFRHLTQSFDVARCAHDKDQKECIKLVEEFITNEIGQDFSFSKKNSDRLWNFLGEFYQSTLPKSFKRKERDFDTHIDSSAHFSYELRSRKDSSGAVNFDADLKKLMEAREKARVKAANARRAAKARAKALTEKKVVVVEKKKRKRDEKVEEEEEEDEAEGEEEHGDEGEEEEEDEAEGEEEHGDEGEVGVEGGEGAGRDEAEEVARVGDDSEANIVKDSNDIEETDKMEDAFAASYYQEREYLEKSHISIDDEEDWEEEIAPFEPVLPSLDNPQAVLEWIFEQLKDVCSMPVILQALQSIMRGGEDVEDSNNIVISLCEDDQEDFYSNPASADGNRVPAEEEENVVMESEEEKTERQQQ